MQQTYFQPQKQKPQQKPTRTRARTRTRAKTTAAAAATPKRAKKCKVQPETFGFIKGIQNKAPLGGNVLATESAKIIQRKVCLQSKTQNHNNNTNNNRGTHWGGHILIAETPGQLRSGRLCNNTKNNSNSNSNSNSNNNNNKEQ
jgi:hypothetical protein